MKINVNKNEILKKLNIGVDEFNIEKVRILDIKDDAKRVNRSNEYAVNLIINLKDKKQISDFVSKLQDNNYKESFLLKYFSASDLKISKLSNIDIVITPSSIKKETKWLIVV